MAFLYPKNSTYCFWMKNVPLKLVWTSGVKVIYQAVGLPHELGPICGFRDKVFELEPDIPTLKSIHIIGEQRLLH